MPNPFDFIHEMRAANEILVEKLDAIIERLDLLVGLADAHNKIDAGYLETDSDIDEKVAEVLRQDWYGDGK